jgi:putative heme iron utilization protein
MTSPVRPTDEDARRMARDLIARARFGALGVLDPGTGLPMVSRIGVVPGPDARPLALVSDLSHHSRALQENPACSLLLGEPGARGDPLTWPRIGLHGRAFFIRHGAPEHAALAAHYLEYQPKATLYIGFADFALMQMEIDSAHLNGGFGKAFVLTQDDFAR